MADTPETSAHKSIRRRVEATKDGRQSEPLFPFAGNPRITIPVGLPFRLRDYSELADWSGRCLHEGKRGTIVGNLPPILDRLQIDPRHWLHLNKNFESRFKSLVGSAHSVRSACEQLGKRWAHGIRDCERYLSPSVT